MRSWRTTTVKTGPQTRQEETDCYTPLGHSGRIALRREQCDVFGQIPSSLGNLKLDAPVVARQPKVKHLHGYARE
jgi:hypothetical protein